MATTTKEGRYYDLLIPKEMDEDMNKLAKHIGGNVSDVFNRAMSLYYEVKKNQLDDQDNQQDSKSPFLRVVLDDGKGNITEYTDI